MPLDCEQIKKLTTNYMSRPVITMFCLLIALTAIFSSTPAYSQIDFFYGKNNKGLRIGGGGGLAVLATHYNSNPPQLALVGSIDYNFNPYLSIGVEGQYGTLKGVDDHSPHHLYYTSSTNKYATASFNVKAGLGLITDFYSENAFQDAVKRLYIGAGYGVMHKSITFTTDPTLAATQYGDTQRYGYIPVIPFNFGTYIDLPNVLGYDRLEINPNFQFTYIPSMYADGFISSSASHLKGFYHITSVAIKLKF
jgi:hypothetical protein